MTHQHEHQGQTVNEPKLSGRKIFWVTVLNAAITAAEVVGGLLSGSLALLSDAVHNLSDTIAVAMSYVAWRISQKPRDIKRTFGYKRAEILSAFVNSAILLAVLSILLFESVKRLQTPETIDSTLMIIVAVIGLVANLASVLLLEKDSKSSLNIKASYLHLISDTVSSVGVVIGGILIKTIGIIWIDPVITVLISLWILKETWHVMKKATAILMQSSAALDYDAIKKDIEAIGKVKNVHHVHTWMSNESTIYFEAHIDMEDISLCEAGEVYEEVEHLLRERYGVSHVTLQAESDVCMDKAMFKC
ncbi:MAG: cation diffusion facilitator family transporter [Christensenellales bacterium]